MPAGRPPKPTEQKRRAGNPGKRSLPEPLVLLPAAETTPEPVRPLGGPGRALWDRVWAAGARWVSPTTDVELLQIVCESVDERSALRYQVLQPGQNDPHLRAALRALDAQVVSGLSLLGFTPSDRARLGVAEVVAQSTLKRLREGRS